uniref:Uncharacterized protein n=1 Tax=Phlebotomus papatasi TaxID=29031 RepID=A0A1B0D262_PHLPP
MMSVIKLFFVVLLVGAATALECYQCSSSEIGDACIQSNVTNFKVTQCKSHEYACYITLIRNSGKNTTGIAERGCALNYNYCEKLIHERDTRLALSCYVCTTSRCNFVDALTMHNSSTKITTSFFLILLPLLVITRKIFISG